MAIPIENIYFLLCYAWNKLDEKNRVEISIDDSTRLIDLFAKVLINGTKILLKRGIDRSYIDHTDEVSGIRGKLQLSQTVKSNLLQQQKTICTYDEFSADILINKILYTTICQLCRTRELDKQLKNELYSISRMFSDITLINISSSTFRQISINRNNRFYGFIMDVCRIIYENLLPSEVQGQYKFIDFQRDDAKMAKLFETFVFNFYKLEQTSFKVKRESILWSFQDVAPQDLEYLPNMLTDITLESESRKIIIDAKYYRETMKVHYSKERINSGNLYQLFSYLLNQEDSTSKTQNATGILLYPTVKQEYDLDFRYKDHTIFIRTINLNMNWQDITERLHEIIA